ncbi:hypothetical protein LEP1GSC047_4400 [Leptospira inadai serovar Lyme str. 10]|uniref:Uncharacterized protein n=1 Tax=Leptospira inadai serovar Lyme str. 10 TaxID=1049790 RepID=V6HL81_9LEPT|nr:hypothetical protein [Leptospira inadai]EQA37660.1 hypothetical protein LEP1GSC047_4400 [Leptospira inadai serovar Lyme str. 10]
MNLCQEFQTKQTIESVANASQAMEGVASAKDAVEPNPLGRRIA